MNHFVRSILGTQTAQFGLDYGANAFNSVKDSIHGFKEKSTYAAAPFDFELHTSFFQSNVTDAHVLAVIRHERYKFLAKIGLVEPTVLQTLGIEFPLPKGVQMGVEFTASSSFIPSINLHIPRIAMNQGYANLSLSGPKEEGTAGFGVQGVKGMDLYGYTIMSNDAIVKEVGAEIKKSYKGVTYKMQAAYDTASRGYKFGFGWST